MKQKTFKFYSLEYSEQIEWLDEDFKRVCNPTIYKDSSLPDGHYMIRGDKKYHRKEYHKEHDLWWLVSKSTFDKGQHSVDSTIYKLFPSLLHKEYVELKKHKSKLTNMWKRHVYGYFFWLELRIIERNIKKDFLYF